MTSGNMERNYNPEPPKHGLNFDRKLKSHVLKCLTEFGPKYGSSLVTLGSPAPSFQSIATLQPKESYKSKPDMYLGKLNTDLSIKIIIME